MQLSIDILQSDKKQRMKKTEWLLCPNCINKTRIKICDNTVLENFPLYCPKCKQEMIISVKQFNTTVITEPDA